MTTNSVDEAARAATPVPNVVRASRPSRPIRAFAGAAFIAIWIALGYLVHLGVNAYLLVGIPLTLIFQLVIKREPVRALWVRSAPRLARTGKFYITATILMAVPAYTAYRATAAHSAPPIVLWMAACIAGVVAAAYALQSFDRVALRALLVCLATGGLIGVLLITLAFHVRHAAIPKHALLTGVRWFLLYFPAAFMLEEVSFRGAIDSYIHGPGETHPWMSALFVSALWGLWHLPTVPHPTVGVAIELVVSQSLTGVPLSFAWRRSGNLAVSSTVHALLDAVRNGLGIMS